MVIVRFWSWLKNRFVSKEVKGTAKETFAKQLKLNFKQRREALEQLQREEAIENFAPHALSRYGITKDELISGDYSLAKFYGDAPAWRAYFDEYYNGKPWMARDKFYTVSGFEKEEAEKLKKEVGQRMEQLRLAIAEKTATLELVNESLDKQLEVERIVG